MAIIFAMLNLELIGPFPLFTLHMVPFQVYLTEILLHFKEKCDPLIAWC
jgi:hypothetical protein